MRHLVAALVAAASLAVPAGATEPLLAGDVCHFSSLSDSADSTHRIGEVDGGPIAAADVALVAPDAVEAFFDNPVSITLTCTMRLDPSVTHLSPAVAEASATGQAVAVVPPTPVEWYEPQFWEPAWVCTHVAVTTRDGQTADLYWDSWNGEFATDPGVACGGPIACPQSGDPCGPDLGRVLQRLWEDVVDPAICPALAQAFPPEGDIPDVWECPPYE